VTTAAPTHHDFDPAGQIGVQLAHKYVTTDSKAGIKAHIGTGSAIITRANVNSPAIMKYLYTP
jgi:hypothetical protein